MRRGRWGEYSGKWVFALLFGREAGARGGAGVGRWSPGTGADTHLPRAGRVDWP